MLDVKSAPKMVERPVRFTDMYWTKRQQEEYWWKALQVDGLMPHATDPVSVRQDGWYHCGACGHSWRPGARFLWWPIRLRWTSPLYGRSAWFRWHGWEVESTGIEQHLFGWTMHLGWLKVLFGR